jgi:hypothetical protein
MIRLFIFLLGLVLFLAGAATNFERIYVRMPVDLKSVAVGIGPTVFSLDVLCMVVGVFLVLIAWVFTRLSQ